MNRELKKNSRTCSNDRYHSIAILWDKLLSSIEADRKQIENGNIANQIHGFTIDHGNFILIRYTVHFITDSSFSGHQMKMMVAGLCVMTRADFFSCIAFGVSSTERLLMPCKPKQFKVWLIQLKRHWK